ncbi:MAG: preprotein translocase subunit SecG [Bacteroides sp.]|nr:preprotein translocase subunit SecG [Bacteroides sp.]
MKNKKFSLFLILGLMMIGLTACSSRNGDLLSKKDLNKEYVQTTKILDESRGVVGKQVDKKSKSKKIKLNRQNKNVLLENLSKLNKSNKKLDYSVKSAAKYPKALRDYNNQTIDYIKGLLKEETKKEAVQQFHQATKTAYQLQFQYVNEENKYLDIAIASDQASGKQIDQGVSIKEASKSKNKDKKKHQSKANNENKKLENKLGMKVKKTKVTKKKPPVNIPLGWVIWFTLIAIVLIVSVFLQPNKSNDSMSALTNSGGAELYNRPKPIGYQLFLQRVTEGSIAVLVISLIIFNAKGM